MPKFTLSFSIDATAFPILEKIRDGMTSDQFFRNALELGLCELMESMSRMHRDMTLHFLAGNTMDYKQGRAVLFRVSDPDNADKPAPPEGE
jgi:hypothetical protein